MSNPEQVGTTRIKKPLSKKQLAQRVAAGQARARQFTPEYQRAAALALREKVSREYYRHIGRRGGRRTMFRMLMRIAKHWNFSPDEIATSKVSAQKRADLVWGMRAHYQQEAARYIDPAWGNKVFLAFFAPELEPTTKKRRRPGKPEQTALATKTRTKLAGNKNSNC